MATGTVRWFNTAKGYGFIQPQNGGKDVFVHISAVERAGLSTLNEGQQVEYEIVDNRGKSSAENLKHGYTRILRGNPNKGKTHMWRLAGFVLFAVVAGLAIYVSGVDADKKPEKKRTVDDRRVEGLWGEGVYE